MSLQLILGNFALILFVAMIITGVIWFLDIFYFARKRRAAADAALKAFDAGIAKLTAEGVKPDYNSRQALEQGILRQPTWIEYSGSFFPVIALVFFLRSFLYEPFKIPTSSMVPTLLVGDLILVNKFTYGVRLPVLNQKIIDVGDPQRGDVMVFKFPGDMSQDYIKRVVGVPGDKITYENKRLSVNGKDVAYTPLDDYLDDESLQYQKQFTEMLSSNQHRVLQIAGVPSYKPDQVLNFPNREACVYAYEKFSCIVPEGNYFMMGDNRDKSSDSRYWGFVPNKNIVGKAFFVWMNISSPSRVGSIQ